MILVGMYKQYCLSDYSQDEVQLIRNSLSVTCHPTFTGQWKAYNLSHPSLSEQMIRKRDLKATIKAKT